MNLSRKYRNLMFAWLNFNEILLFQDKCIETLLEKLLKMLSATRKIDVRSILPYFENRIMNIMSTADAITERKPNPVNHVVTATNESNNIVNLAKAVLPFPMLHGPRISRWQLSIIHHCSNYTAKTRAYTRRCGINANKSVENDTNTVFNLPRMTNRYLLTFYRLKPGAKCSKGNNKQIPLTVSLFNWNCTVSLRQAQYLLKSLSVQKQYKLLIYIFFFHKKSA